MIKIEQNMKNIEEDNKVDNIEDKMRISLEEMKKSK